MQCFRKIVAFFIEVCYNAVIMFSFVYKDIDFAHKVDNPSSPTEEYAKHLHSFYEILYFVSGKTEYTVESESRRLMPGDIIMIAPGQYHFADVNPKVKYERYVLKLPAEAIPEIVKRKLKNKGAFFADNRKFAEFFQRLDTYVENFDEEEAYTMLLCEIVMFLVTFCRKSKPQKATHNEFIDALLIYIDENIREPLSVAHLAKKFNYSNSFLNIEFKKHMKIPLMQYIKSKKIMEAHRLILSGAKKCKVAETFGFDTYSTFYRLYYKYVNPKNR